MTFNVEVIERLPDWFDPTFDIQRMNQTVQIVERRFQVIEASLSAIDIANLGAAGVGTESAPLEHTHGETEITDLGDGNFYVSVEYLEDTFILGSISDVDLTGAGPNEALVRNPANDGWITQLIIGGGGGSAFNPTIVSPQEGDVIYFNGAVWVNISDDNLGKVDRDGDSITGTLLFEENFAELQWLSGQSRIYHSTVSDYLAVTSSRGLFLAGASVFLMPTFGTLDVSSEDDQELLIDIYATGTNIDALLNLRADSGGARIWWDESALAFKISQTNPAGDTVEEDWFQMDDNGAVTVGFNGVPTLRTQDQESQVQRGSTWQNVIVGADTVKPDSELLNNSAALQDDDDLFYVTPDAGFYAFELWFVADAQTSTTPNLQFDFTFSGTLAASGYSWIATDQAGTVTADGQGAVTTASIVNVPVTTDQVSVKVTGYIDVTAVGTLQWRWAQNTATAEDTTVREGSNLMVRRRGDT